MRKLNGSETLIVIVYSFLLLLGLFSKGINLDQSLALILGLALGAVALKKWVVNLIHRAIEHYDMDSDIIQSSTMFGYRIITGFILIIVTSVLASLMYFTRMVSVFAVGFIISWFFIGMGLLFDSHLYRFFASDSTRQKR